MLVEYKSMEFTSPKTHQKSIYRWNESHRKPAGNLQKIYTTKAARKISR